MCIFLSTWLLRGPAFGALQGTEGTSLFHDLKGRGGGGVQCEVIEAGKLLLVHFNVGQRQT